MLTLFHTLSEKDKSDAIEWMIRGSTPRQDFFFMILLSILMATFGLLLNNVAVIIGSMLIAPILYPILGVSMGITMSDNSLISRSSWTLVKSSAVGIFASFVATLFFPGRGMITAEILSRTQPSLPYAAIAVIAGLAASFALVKPHLNEMLPGVAISVALIPPLAVVGIGIAQLDWNIISGSLLLYVVNIAGVVFASMVTFSLMNFYVKRNVAQEVTAKEDLKVEIEKKTAENNNSAI